MGQGLSLSTKMHPRPTTGHCWKPHLSNWQIINSPPAPAAAGDRRRQLARRRGARAEVVSLAKHVPSNRQGSRSNHPALPGTPPYPRRGVFSSAIYALACRNCRLSREQKRGRCNAPDSFHSFSHRRGSIASPLRSVRVFRYLSGRRCPGCTGVESKKVGTGGRGSHKNARKWEARGA